MNAASLNGAVNIEETALPPRNDFILNLFEKVVMNSYIIVKKNEIYINEIYKKRNL